MCDVLVQGAHGGTQMLTGWINWGYWGVLGALDACSAAQQVGTYVSSIAGLHSTVVQFSHTGHVTFSAVFIYYIDLSGAWLLYGKMSKIGKRGQETSKTVKKADFECVDRWCHCFKKPEAFICILNAQRSSELAWSNLSQMGAGWCEGHGCDHHQWTALQTEARSFLRRLGCWWCL